MVFCPLSQVFSISFLCFFDTPRSEIGRIILLGAHRESSQSDSQKSKRSQEKYFNFRRKQPKLSWVVCWLERDAHNIWWVVEDRKIFSFRGELLNYLWSIAPIRVLAAREGAACVNTRVFCCRILTSLSFTLPSWELVRVLTIKSHSLLSPLRKFSAITCCLFIDIRIDCIT